MAEIGQHLADAGEDGVVRPAFTVVAGAVVAGEGDAFGGGSVGEKVDGPLFDGRADEVVEGAVALDAAGVDDFLQAAEDAGFGVGEGSVEVED